MTQFDSHAPANVLTLHPDPLIRAGIAAALREHGGFNVSQEPLDHADRSEDRVDVVIADHCQALGLAGGATSGNARGAVAGARVLVLTTLDREADIRRAIEAGVDGYLLLGCALGEFVEAVSALARGSRYLGRLVAQRMAESLTRTSLTSRETDVLKLVVAGESNKAIARRLCIEVGTVKTHVNGILGKLNATSRTQAAAIAVTQGIVGERLPLSTSRLEERRQILQ